MLLNVVSLCALVHSLNAEGFDYPATLPPPKDFQIATIMTTILPFIGSYETPIAIRALSMLDQVSWDCVAVYHPHALSSITKQRPIVVANDDTITNYGNSQTRMLCAAYAFSIINIFIMPESKMTTNQFLSNMGLNAAFSVINSDVAQCEVTDAACLNDVAEANGYIPEILASIVAYQGINYLKNDGWNQDGSIGVNGGKCTANCRPYADTTGYTPNLNKRNSWVPLSEDDGKGFFYHYDHVTPHIGYTSTTKTITRQELESNSAPRPLYKYFDEKQLVIDRLADLAQNDTMKMLVEFFDNKVNVGISILLAMEITLGWSFEERLLWMVGYTSVEYDAVVQSWREKVKWDKIRPTSLIKADGLKQITTYAGPYKGLQTINSVDFESYHRVMPHSEYPSASGCLCLSVTKFSDIFLENRYGITDSIAVQVPVPGASFAAGSSIIEPGQTPANDIFVTFNNLKDLSDICGESRLWGGMHFTDSVPASRTLCDTFGDAGYQYVIDLLDGHPL